MLCAVNVYRFCKRVFALCFKRQCKAKKLVFGNIFRRVYIRYDRLSCCYGACFIKHGYLSFSCLLKRNGGLEKYAVLCADTVSDHYRNGSGKSECTRTAYNKHRYSSRQSISEILSEQEPHYRSDNGNCNNGRNEYSRYLVGNLRNGRFCCRRIAHHFYYLR